MFYFLNLQDVHHKVILFKLKKCKLYFLQQDKKKFFTFNIITVWSAKVRAVVKLKQKWNITRNWLYASPLASLT